MKRLFTQIILSVFCIQLIMVGFPSANVCAAEPLVNIVKFGDMETKTAPSEWTDVDYATKAEIKIVEDTENSNNHVLRFDGTNNEGNLSFMRYDKALENGKEYYYSYKIRIAEGYEYTGNLYAYMGLTTGAKPYDTYRPLLSTEWVTRSGTLTGADNKMSFKIISDQTTQSSNVTKVIYEIDDIVICDITDGEGDVLNLTTELNDASLRWETGVVKMNDELYARPDSTAAFSLTPPSYCEINTVMVNEVIVTPVNNIYNIEIPDDLEVSINVDVIEDDGVPKLLSTSPENGYLNADTNDMVLKVAFDREMSIDSLKSDITVKPKASFEVEASGEYTYDLVFDELMEGTDYTVLFTDKLSSELGVTMTNSEKYTFTTEFPYVNIIENGDMSDTSSLSMYSDNGQNSISYTEIDGNSVLNWEVNFDGAPLFQYLNENDGRNEMYNFVGGHKYYVKARVKADKAIKMSWETVYYTDADKTTARHDKKEVNIEADKWIIVHNYFTIPNNISLEGKHGVRLGANKANIYVDDIELIDCSVAPGGIPDFVSSYPEKNASEIEIGKGELEMSITFDEALLPTTVNATNITAEQATINDIRVSEDKKTCILSLSGLKVNKIVKINYKNLSTLALEKVEDGDILFYTKTMSTAAPSIVKASPNNGEKLKLSSLKNVEIEYDLPLDGPIDKSSFSTVPENLIESVDWSYDTPNSISIKLNEECLSEGTTYSVTLLPSVKSLAGTPIEEKTIIFSTITQDEIVESFKDTLADNSQGNVQGVLDFMTEYYGDLNPDDKLIKNMLQKDEEISEMVATQILAGGVDPDADADDIVETILTTAALIIANNSQDEELIGDAVNSILIVNNMTEISNAYNALNDSVKVKLCSNIKSLTNDFKTCQDFTDYLEQEIIFTALQKANGWKAISDILNNNIEFFSSGTKDLINKINSSSNKAEIYLKLQGITASSEAEIYDVLKKAYDNSATEPNKKPVGLGGGGGGGGGGGMTPFVSEDQTEMPAINEEKAPVFKDIESVPWAKEAIEHFYELEVITGKTSDTFCPNDFVTREEFVKMIVLAADVPMTDATNKYSDVEQNEWYYPYISAATKAKLVQGIDNMNFGIGQNITRQDIATICNRLLGASDDGDDLSESAENIISDYNEISEYAIEAVDRLASLNIIKGDENSRFAPKNYATRAETVVMLQRLIAYINSEGR